MSLYYYRMIKAEVKRDQAQYEQPLTFSQLLAHIALAKKKIVREIAKLLCRSCGLCDRNNVFL